MLDDNIALWAYILLYKTKADVLHDYLWLWEFEDEHRCSLRTKYPTLTH